MKSPIAQKKKMSGLIGCVSEFNPEFEDWQVYSEKLEQYFQANKISDSKIQVATLLSLVGTATYKLLRDLSYPKLPKDKSYEELNILMTDQFSPVVSVWRERIRFYIAHQNERESVSEWYARVRNLAVNCKFGEQLTSILRDKFVCGLKGGPVQDRLCEEDEKKSLEALFQLAVQKESINAQSNRNQEINVLKLAPKFKGGYVKKHVPGRGSGNGALDARRRESSVKFQRSMSSSTEKNQNKGLFGKSCKICGKGHESKCRYANYKCRVCSKVGHLEAVCKNRQIHNHNMIENVNKVNVNNMNVNKNTDFLNSETHFDYNDMLTINKGINNAISLGGNLSEVLKFQLKLKGTLTRCLLIREQVFLPLI